jgi:hypothetical protein
VLAIELLAAVTGIRHRLASLHLSNDDLGSGTRVVIEVLQKAAPQIFQLPLHRDVVIYPYLRAAEDVVRSGALVKSLRETGFHFREVRSLTTVQ